MKAMTMFWSISAATFFSFWQHQSDAKGKVVDLPATPRECSTIQFKLNARKIGKDVARSSDRIGVGARWLLQDPELIPLSSGTCLSAAKDRQYFLLALPLNIKRGSGYVKVTVKLVAADAAIDGLPNTADLRIESMFPVHQYLADQFQHQLAFGAQLEPTFSGFGAGSLSVNSSFSHAYELDVPRIVGTLDSANLTAQWEFFKAKGQAIDPGTVTTFLLLSMPVVSSGAEQTRALPTFRGPISLTVAQYVSPKQTDPKDRVGVWNKLTATRALQDYLLLHEDSLPAASVQLVNNLLGAKDMTRSSVAPSKFTITVSPQH
jgi:hypothetical protein